MILCYVGGSASLQGAPNYQFLSKGVPVGGPMDASLASLTNIAAGNAPETPILEFSLGELTIEAVTDMVFVVGHASIADLRPRLLRAGEKQTLVAMPRGHWSYLAVEGGFAQPPLVTRWLASGEHVLRVPPHGSLPDHRSFHPEIEREIVVHDLRWAALLKGEWCRAESSFNRMGIGLERVGESPEEEILLRLPSSPMCVGAIQKNPGGKLTVIGPDGPTIGGYALAGVLNREEMDRLVRIPFGESFRFTKA